MRLHLIAAVVLCFAGIFTSVVDSSRVAAQDIVNPGGGIDPGGVIGPGRGPSFILGFRGDDVVLNGSSIPVSTAVVCTLTTSGLDPDEPGVQGWSFGVLPRGPCRIGGYFTHRMASGSLGVGGLVQEVGFSRTDILDDGAGIIQGVVLSFTTPVTLSPADSPHDLLGLYIETGVPEGDECQTCTLTYTDRLQGDGQPVAVIVTVDGESNIPRWSNKEIQICPPVSCFDQGEIGPWTFTSASSATGSAQINDAGRIEICGHGSGYGALLSNGDPVDNVNIAGQTLSGGHDFQLYTRLRRFSGAGYGGLEIRPRGVNSRSGFDASSPVLAFGVRSDSQGQLSLETFARGIGGVEFSDPVGFDSLPIDLRIERRDGVMIGSYSTGGDFREILRTTAAGVGDPQAGHFNRSRRLHVGLAQASDGLVTEEGRLTTASVYFGDPGFEVELPPPPPPHPDVNIAPGTSGQLELVGVDIGSIVSVKVAGLDAIIVSKEDGRAVITVPDTGSPVRGDIVINRGDSSSVIRNAFFRYGTGFIRGDCNDDERIDVSDAIKIFNYLFLDSEDTCVCKAATDSNGDAREDISDGIWMLNYLFSGGEAPPAPFPERGFSEESDSSDICGLEQHLPVITNITVMGPVGAAAGDRPVQIAEGTRLRIDGRNFSSNPRRNTIVGGDASFEIVDATTNSLLVDVLRVATTRLIDIGIIRDFSPIAESTTCFEDDCPPAVIGPLVKFPGAFELQASEAVAVIGSSRANPAANGLILELDPVTFSPNARLGGREVSIEAMLDIPVVQGSSAGARRVSVTEIFPSEMSGAEGVRQVADSLRRGLSAGGRLSQVAVIPDVNNSRILIEPTVDILPALGGEDGRAAGLPVISLLRGVLSVYDTPFGRCGPDNLHPIDDERAFGWCRFEEIVEPCDGLPAFEWFFTHDETFSNSEVPEHIDPDDRSPGSKEVLYNLAAYCHIREHRLWCGHDLDDLVNAGADDIPPFPRAAWVMKTSWIHEDITTSGLAGAGTNMNAAAAAFGLTDPAAIQAWKDSFYSYVYSGNDPNHPGWPAGRYYMRAIHHTTKDIDDWYWYDAYIWGGGPTTTPIAGSEPKIGGCGGSSEDAPVNIANHPTWGEYRLCTNVTNTQRNPGPNQRPEPSGADVGPQANGDPSAFCGNFLIAVECPPGLSNPDPFFGTATNADTCLNCHETASWSGMNTDFLHSIPFRGTYDCTLGGGTTVSFSTSIEPLLNNICSGCHNGIGGSLPGSMNLSTGNSYSSLMGVASDELPSMDRVEPNFPTLSYFLHKLNGTHISVGGSGTQMPPSAPLSAGDRQNIEDWIDAGAPNN